MTDISEFVKSISTELRAMKSAQRQAAASMPSYVLETDISVPTYSFATTKPSHTGTTTLWLYCNTSTIVATPYFTSGEIANIYWQPVHKSGAVGWKIANYNSYAVSLHIKVIANQKGRLATS